MRAGMITLSKLSGNKRQQIMIVTSGSLIFNLLYAVYHGVIGVWGQSLWFITMGMYYGVLSIMRALAVKEEYRPGKTVQIPRELSIMKRVGILLLISASRMRWYPYFPCKCQCMQLSVKGKQTTDI